MEYTQLYETKDKIILRHNESGKMKDIVKPQFADKQFVKTSPKHFSQKSFTQVIEPKWNDKRGWIYGECYVSRNGNRGGSGWWSDQDMFEELTDAQDILIAEKLTREESLKFIKLQTKRLETELRYINFGLSFLKEA